MGKTEHGRLRFPMFHVISKSILPHPDPNRHPMSWPNNTNDRDINNAAYIEEPKYWLLN